MFKSELGCVGESVCVSEVVFGLFKWSSCRNPSYLCKSELSCVSENICVIEGVWGDVGTGEGLVVESIF